MKRAAHLAIHLLAILVVLIMAFVIVALIHYAVYGNPIKDTEHIINEVKRI